jgi:phosphoserine phosphatase
MTSKTFAEVLDKAFEQSCRMDASLNERLQAFADTVRKLNPTFAEAVDRLVVRLQETGAGMAEGDEAVQCITATMSANAPYKTLQRTVLIHPTVSELIPTLLASLVPLPADKPRV